MNYPLLFCGRDEFPNRRVLRARQGCVWELTVKRVRISRLAFSSLELHHGGRAGQKSKNTGATRVPKSQKVALAPRGCLKARKRGPGLLEKILKRPRSGPAPLENIFKRKNSGPGPLEKIFKNALPPGGGVQEPSFSSSRSQSHLDTFAIIINNIITMPLCVARH